MRSKIRHEIIASNKGYGNKDRMLNTNERYCEFAGANNRQRMEIRNADFRAYIEHRRYQGLALGTLQNEAAHIRFFQSQLNRRKPLTLTNKELGISNRRRVGTKRPIAESEFWANLRRINDTRVVVAALLSRLLGLRRMEAIRCGPSLKDWRNCVEQGYPVRIIHGTKGRRLRFSESPYPELLLSVIDEAIALCRLNKGCLIKSPGGDLKSAVSYYARVMSKAGFKGEISPHSLRYAYTHDLGALYRAARNVDVRECLRLLALNLGHGAGRLHFVRHTYYRKIGSEWMNKDMSLEDVYKHIRMFEEIGFEQVRKRFELGDKAKKPRMSLLAKSRSVAFFDKEFSLSMATANSKGDD